MGKMKSGLPIALREIAEDYFNWEPERKQRFLADPRVRAAFSGPNAQPTGHHPVVAARKVEPQLPTPERAELSGWATDLESVLSRLLGVACVGGLPAGMAPGIDARTQEGVDREWARNPTKNPNAEPPKRAAFAGLRDAVAFRQGLQMWKGGVMSPVAAMSWLKGEGIEAGPGDGPVWEGRDLTVDLTPELGSEGFYWGMVAEGDEFSLDEQVRAARMSADSRELELARYEMLLFYLRKASIAIADLARCTRGRAAAFLLTGSSLNVEAYRVGIKGDFTGLVDSGSRIKLEFHPWLPDPEVMRIVRAAKRCAEADRGAVPAKVLRMAAFLLEHDPQYDSKPSKVKGAVLHRKWRESGLAPAYPWLNEFLEARKRAHEFLVSGRWLVSGFARPLVFEINLQREGKRSGVSIRGERVSVGPGVQ